MSWSAPVTPAKKIRSSPTTTPRKQRIQQEEDKILVTVRVRPLTPRELASYDLIAWDSPDENTLIKCLITLAQVRRSMNKGLKMLPSLLSMELMAVESKFVLKFSALEIYNEIVVDLLNRDLGPLRLLDDSEKGTVVEKLTEEVVNDAQHLRRLISTCEAQRQVGETSLNDRSSRSHQIIKLTIESSLHDASGCVRSLLASLSLVDLAGSERAAQTNADGARLKEGSHINRSLLTLTTVIRKLSGGKKSGHIPYRDSKLTRILQSSLGGNARTAIICTMSPALSHVDQSRNTLSFATSAKEVTNNAQVNMVVAEKRLVKDLQKEVTRLKAELLSPEPSSSKCLRSLLLEKENIIQQMQREMNELKRERDLAQSQLEVARKLQKETKVGFQDAPSICLFPLRVAKWASQVGPKLGYPFNPLNLSLEGGTYMSLVYQEPIQCVPSRQVAKCLSFSSENVSELSERKARRRRGPLRQSTASLDPSTLVHEIRKLEMRQRQLGQEANHALELLHKEVSSHRVGNKDAAETIAKLLSDIKDMHANISLVPDDIEVKKKGNLKEEIGRLINEENTIASLEEKLENVQKSLDKLVLYNGEEDPDSRTPLKKKKILPFRMSNNGSMPNFIRSPCSPSSANIHGVENRNPECHGLLSPVNISQNKKPDEEKKSTPMSASKHPSSVNVRKIQMMFKTAAEDNIRSIKSYVTELKERVAKLQYQKQLLVCQVLELEEANDGGSDDTDLGDQTPMPRHLVYEDQRKQIIMLWHLCHVSIIHRTQFFMLFKGEPADDIYVEVELRRLTWLEQHLSELGNASPALLGDEPAGSVASSIKALKQEREYLAKRVSSQLSAEEREMLYRKWDIPVEGKQRRRLQLVNRLWTDPLNMAHVKESAEIVAKLVGFCESGEHAPKEMFALNFVNPSDKKAWMGWNLISDLLHL
ncbi:kinesin-like protein NACK2 [Tanacetum coccineum]